MKESHLRLASESSYCLLSLHHADHCEILLGDPRRILGISGEEFADLDARIVGSAPKPRPWMQPCESTQYLARLGSETAWLESRSTRDDSGGILMSTRVLGLPSDGQELLRLSRLCMAGGLLGPIAHELNNTVQGLASIEYLFRDCLDNGHPIEMVDLDQLTLAIESLKGLGAGLQGFARMGHTEIQELKVAQVLERAIALLKSTGRLKTVDVELHIAPDLPDVHWRLSELDFVVLSLIGNAADAALEAAMPRVDLSARAIDGGVELSIADSGAGFDLASAEKPFVTSKPTHRYAGLGLTSVQAILGARGGRLEQDRDAAGRLLMRVHLPTETRRS